MSGGEPTMSPWFKKLVDKIYDTGGTIGVTTNLVRNLEYWKNENGEELFNKFHFINCSFHPVSFPFEEYNKFEEDFFEKAYYISKHTNVTARIMMVPEQRIWNRLLLTFEKYKKYSETLNLEPVKILPNFGVGEDYCEINYTQEQLEWLFNYQIIPKTIWSTVKTIFQPPFPTIVYGRKDYYPDKRLWCGQILQSNEDVLSQDILTLMTNSGFNNFNGWKCDIGLESLFVHYDGTVMRGNCGVGGHIGNIIELDKIKWPVKPIICDKNICHCVADILMSKKK
jgi:hypothetical protein